MRLRTQRALGLAFDDEAIVIAEITVSGTRRTLSRTAVFELPDTPAEPASVGKALAQFMRAQRIPAHGAALGIPARWLVTKQVTLPPADAASRAGMVRIQAEHAFAHGAGELVIDHTCDGDPSHRGTVLLCAAPRERVDRAVAIARAAGLEAVCATPTVVALARAAGAGGGGGGSRVDLLVRPGRVDAAVVSGDRLQAVRHLAAGAEEDSGGSVWSERLPNEIRRMLLTREAQGADDAGGSVVVWDGTDLPPKAMAALKAALACDACDAGSLDALLDADTSSDAKAAGASHAGAAALACAVLDPTLLAIDFLSSRLRPVVARRFNRRFQVAAAAAAVVVLLVGWRVLDWQLAEYDVGVLTQRLQEQGAQVQDARALREKVSFADGWLGVRPLHLECLLELSRAFPEDGRIWATQVSLPQDLRGVVSGRAADDGAVLAVFERLQGSPAFSEVTLHGGITYPKAAARDRFLAFSISFRMRARQP